MPGDLYSLVTQRLSQLRARPRMWAYTREAFASQVTTLVDLLLDHWGRGDVKTQPLHHKWFAAPGENSVLTVRLTIPVDDQWAATCVDDALALIESSKPSGIVDTRSVSNFEPSNIKSWYPDTGWGYFSDLVRIWAIMQTTPFSLQRAKAETGASNDVIARLVKRGEFVCYNYNKDQYVISENNLFSTTEVEAWLARLGLTIVAAAKQQREGFKPDHET